MLFNELKENPLYQRFLKDTRRYCIGMLILLGVFWSALLYFVFAYNATGIKIWLSALIFGFCTFLVIGYGVILSREPKRILKGVIENVKENIETKRVGETVTTLDSSESLFRRSKRTVRQPQYASRTTYFYLINCNGTYILAKYALDSSKNTIKQDIGEEVLVFSCGFGLNYFVTVSKKESNTL